MPPRLKSITIENFRSIGDEPLTIKFPENTPVILVGENNSGKSNIIRAIELMFGEFHPKFKKLEDFDYFQRNPSNEIVIQATVNGLVKTLGKYNSICVGFKFKTHHGTDNYFCAIQSDDGEENVYVSTELRNELLCIKVDSEQNLNYQLSYASKFTLLSKVTKAFHDKLVDDDKRVERLKVLFKNIVEIFSEVEEFENFKNNMSTIADQMLKNMTHALEFDFSAYDPSNYFKSLRVQPTEDGKIRAFEELGTGQQQILALSFAHAYAKSFLGMGLIFIVDEPEAHLHPLAQRWLANHLFQMAEDGLQVIITTHSPYFLNLKHLEGIYLVRKINQTHVYNLTSQKLVSYCIEKGATKTNEETIIPFYDGNSTPEILNGLFAKKIILVEGFTEEYSLPIYLKSVDLDTLRDGIAIISVGGKGNLAKWWRFFTCFKIPTFICFDNDSHSDSLGNKRNDALKTIGIPEEEIKEVLSNDIWNINQYFCVFGKDFEDTLRASFKSYSSIEMEEKNRLGDSKPIIARAVAKRLVMTESYEKEIGGKKFNRLARFIDELND